MSEKGSRANQECNAPCLDTSLTFEQRVDGLIARMTLQEKVSQMVNAAGAIERLGVPDYEWWNECLHGVARAGIATVFPQAIGLAATWNTELIRRVGTATSDEARAKHHHALRQGNRGRYFGLTFWSPNINIFRDPRWGRGQETYGEDPYLTARMGVEFVRGLQGDDPKYLKAAACAKHYAVHSGPESIRHRFDAVVSERDLRETYLPAFESLVTEAKVESVMGAYNRTNGEPCCAHKRLLQDILRDEWGFAGHVVSDCGGICDIHEHHKLVETPEEAAALSVKAGCDLNCGKTYVHLQRAAALGLIDAETIDRSLKRLLLTRFKLGMFDPPESVPYAQIPIEVNDCEEHAELALQTARESIVLLKNDGVLPLARDLGCVAVIGPNADEVVALLGNYEGTPSNPVTPLEGIRRAVPDSTEVLYARGCELIGESREGFDEAVAAAQKADAVVIVLGLSARIEGEEGAAKDSEASGDRTTIELPGVQAELLKAVCTTGKPVVLVLVAGSAIAIRWAQENVPGILMTWYGGQAAGTALSEVLFGDYNPAGRLPVTFYRSGDQLPPFEDYDMSGRTYRYFEGNPLYPFGFGLSYTKFEYSELKVSPDRATAKQSVKVTATVTNTGKRTGDEVVQVYIRDVEASTPRPIRQLAGFARIHLAPGENREVSFTIAPKQLSLINDKERRVIEPGEFEVSVGGAQPIAADADGQFVTGKFEVIGGDQK